MSRQRIGLLVLCTAFVAGCAPVQPWERGDLAKPQMAMDPNPTHSGLRAHVFASREAAQGGNAAVGGGCGCN